MPEPLTGPDNPSPRRLPDWPLPPYRYVPGLHPHPIKHADGHRGGPPDPTGQNRLWERGHDLLDHHYFWEAHEVWEDLWRQTPAEDPFRDLLQACIQLAALVLKKHLGHDRAADSLLRAVLSRLDRLESEIGPEFAGLRLSALKDRARRFAGKNP